MPHQHLQYLCRPSFRWPPAPSMGPLPQLLYPVADPVTHSRHRSVACRSALTELSRELDVQGTTIRGQERSERRASGRTAQRNQYQVQGGGRGRAEASAAGRILLTGQQHSLGWGWQEGGRHCHVKCGSSWHRCACRGGERQACIERRMEAKQRLGGRGVAGSPGPLWPMVRLRT